MDPLPLDTNPDVPAPPVVELRAGLVIACGLPCIHCGYDLRTMRLDGQCPECGKPSADALSGLRAARAEDLARTRWGAVCMLVAALLPLLMVGLAAVGPVLWMLGLGGLFRMGDEGWAWAVGLTCAVAGPIVALGGALRLTEPIRPEVESARPPQHTSAWARPRFRVLAVAYMFASIAAFAFCMYVFQASRPTAASGWGASITITLTALAWTARNFCACRFLATLMHLANAPKVARWLRVLSWLAGAMCVFVALLGSTALLAYLFGEVIDELGAGSQDSWLGVFFAVIAAIYSIGGLGMLVWSIAWPITLALVIRRVRAAERAVGARSGPIVMAAQRVAGV